MFQWHFFRFKHHKNEKYLFLIFETCIWAKNQLSFIYFEIQINFLAAVLWSRHPFEAFCKSSTFQPHFNRSPLKATSQRITPSWILLLKMKVAVTWFFKSCYLLSRSFRSQLTFAMFFEASIIKCWKRVAIGQTDVLRSILRKPLLLQKMSSFIFASLFSWHLNLDLSRTCIHF